MRRGAPLHLALALAAVALLARPAQAAAPAAAPLAALEMAVTYAHGALQVYEIGAGSPGSLMALPVAAGARGLQVIGGSYTLRPLGAAGRSLLVRSAKGQVSARYAIPTATDLDFLFAWRTEAPIGRVLVLTGPQVHPSGLGMTPFTLGGRVDVGGQSLVSFTAQNLPAGFTERWMLELGQPGGWIANLFAALGVALPLLFIAIALRSAFRRKDARRPRVEADRD